MRAGPCASRPPSLRRWRTLKEPTLARTSRARNTNGPPGHVVSRIVEREGRRVAPQPLERVVNAGVFQKYMHQHVAVVEQDPSALGDALGMQDAHAFAPELGADGVRDRLQVRRRFAAADQEV